MPRLVQGAFPGLGEGQLALTLNVRLEDVRYLVQEEFGRCFRSLDQQGLPDEDVAANFARLYRALGIEPPGAFASLALRTHDGGAGLAQTLGAYGTIVLDLNLDELGPDLIIVNGDMKDIARQVMKENDDRYAARIEWSDPAGVAQEIARFYQNSRDNEVPRIHGCYVEARLRRALVLDDVLTVYVDPRDDEAFQAARLLCD